MSLLPEVESALLDAVRRDHHVRMRVPIAGTARAWLRARPRGLLLTAGVLVVCGSAAAAITLSGERSAPLSAVIPAGQQPHTALVAGERYDIEIAPSIRAGNISWCSSIRTYTRSGHPDDLGTGTCDDGAPTAGSPVFGVDNIENGGGLSYVFTGPEVAAIRIAGGPTVLTRADPRLPYGYKAAVFEYKPPRSSPGDLSIPDGAPALVTALDSSERPIRDDFSGPPQEPTRTWLEPSRPASGSCSLAVKPGTGLQAGSGTVVSSIVPAPAIVGSAFLPCIDTDLYLATAQPSGPGRFDASLEAAVLLNAKNPAAPPAALPDMRTVPGHPGVFDRPQAVLPTIESIAPGMTAKRVGHAWLVVAGGTGTAQRVTALDDLLVGPIDLSPPPTLPAAQPRALCRIGYQPVSGLLELTQKAITAPRDTRQAYVDQGQRIISADSARLQRDESRHPTDRAQIVRDQARLALDRLALNRRITNSVGLFPPTCAVATFYYKQRWPMTATLILATNNCPGQRVPVPCKKLRPAWRNTVAQALKPVSGNTGAFTVPANLFHPAETMKQISKWWLVIDGGQNPKQQQLLLSRITTTVAPSLRRNLRNAIATPRTFCARQYPTAC